MRIIAFLTSVIGIPILLLAGPAQAATLGAVCGDPNPAWGDANCPNALCSNVNVHCLGDGDDVLDTTATSVDQCVRAGKGDDTITTGDGNDCVLAGQGNDEVHTGDGTDEIHGGWGEDMLNGGPGDNDVVNGGQCDDAITGDTGSGDTCIGGRGDDSLWNPPGGAIASCDNIDFGNEASMSSHPKCQ